MEIKVEFREYIKNNPQATQEEISKQINKSLRTVKTYMAEMQEKCLYRKKNRRSAIKCTAAIFSFV